MKNAVRSSVNRQGEEISEMENKLVLRQLCF